jgi:hypothetical protein
MSDSSAGGAAPEPDAQRQQPQQSARPVDGREPDLADLFMSFTSPLVNIAELLLSTTAQIDGGSVPVLPRRCTAASVEVIKSGRDEGSGTDYGTGALFRMIASLPLLVSDDLRCLSVDFISRSPS